MFFSLKYILSRLMTVCRSGCVVRNNTGSNSGQPDTFYQNRLQCLYLKMIEFAFSIYRSAYWGRQNKCPILFCTFVLVWLYVKFVQKIVL